MTRGPISKKQEVILEYLKKEILERGYPPSVREICEAVHLKSTSSVHAHLEALEKNGYIKKDATKPRAIEILDEEFQAQRIRRISGTENPQPELASIPVIGQVAAGQPLLAVEQIESYFPFPVDKLPNNPHSFCGSKGKAWSMQGYWMEITFWLNRRKMPETERWWWRWWRTPQRSRPFTGRTAITVCSRKTTIWIPLL